MSSVEVVPARSISVKSRRRRPDDRVDPRGITTMMSREDAITAVSPTRRDGPDAVRNSSNSKNKPLSWK